MPPRTRIPARREASVTHGRSVGSPPLAWVSSLGYSWLVFFRRLSRHAPYLITEEMRVKGFVRGLSSDRRRKEAVAEILARNNGLRDRKVVTPVLVWDLCPVIRCKRERYHKGVVLVGSLLAQRSVVDQIRGDLHGPLFHNEILE
ncbi:hypothetical protein SESBI_03534 [Sesbania bispinosa]|nr:hypothetical protein SESBI_03534 [Sesbania bispinosa]